MARPDETPLKHNYPMHHPILNATSIQRFTFGTIDMIPQSEESVKRLNQEYFANGSTYVYV